MEILEGVGVHSGIACRVELSHRDPDDGLGIRFHLPGHPEPMSAAGLSRLPRRASRATVLGGDADGLRTPEHLLAALLFFGGAPLDVRLTAPEIPILDGSALPFREALARLFPGAAAVPAWREAPCSLAWEQRWPGGYLRARPAPRLSIDCVLSRWPLREACRVDSPVGAYREILEARTWIFQRELVAGREAGLLKGAGPGSGLLLAESEEEHARPEVGGRCGPEGPFPLVSPGRWRGEDEAVRHKVLDLLGDLALLGGTLPSLCIEAGNAGHASHHALVEALLAAHPSWPRY